MQQDVVIRKYRPSERSQIRRICADTACMGEAAENFFSDREVLADLAINYYTDYEPQSLWVAESGGRIVGYLAGCLNTGRCHRMTLLLMPFILIKAIFRGVFLRRQTWALLIAGLKAGLRGSFRRNIPFKKYPAHLHIDIEKDFRGLGIGQRLMDNFIAQSEAADIKGIHLTTLAQNQSACVFFQRLGFRELARYPAINPRDFKRATSVVVYVRELGG